MGDVAGLVGIPVNYLSQQQEREMQHNENVFNRQFNHDEAILAREWSTNERLAQQAYNTQERLATQEWNSPKNQAKQLRAAGVNPAVYFQGGSSGITSNPQSSSVPSATSASYGNGYSPIVSNIPQLMSGFADIVNAFTNKNVGASTVDKMTKETELLIQRIFGEKVSNEILSIQKSIQEAKAPADIKQAFLDLFKTSVDIKLANTQEKKEQANIKLSESQEALNKAITKLNDKQAIVWGERAANAVELIRSELNLNKARTQESYSSAEEHRAGAALKTEQINTEISVQKLNEFKSDIAEIQRNFDTATFEARLKAAFNKLSESEYDALLKKLEAKDKDAYTTVQRILLGKSVGNDGARKVLDIIHDIDRTTPLYKAQPSWK